MNIYCGIATRLEDKIWKLDKVNIISYQVVPHFLDQQTTIRIKILSFSQLPIIGPCSNCMSLLAPQRWYFRPRSTGRGPGLSSPIMHPAYLTTIPSMLGLQLK